MEILDNECLNDFIEKLRKYFKTPINVKMVKAMQKNGGNFLGDIYHCVLSYSERGEEKTLPLFIKQALQDAPPGALLVSKLNKIFRRELFTYTSIESTYMTLQDDFGVPEKEQFLFPEFFGGSGVKGGETIVLQNLEYSGYVIHKRMLPVSASYMEQAIIALAKFHALSFATEKYYPDFFSYQISKKREIIYCYLKEKPQTEFDIKKMNVIKTNFLNSCEGKYREYGEEFLQNYLDKVTSRTVMRQKRVSVYSHSDYRSENIFVKLDESNEVTSVIPVDYQLSHFGSPVNDLIYLIYTTAPTQLRRELDGRWPEIYYSNLKRFLVYFKIDINEIYPKSEFRADFYGNLPFGLYLAVNLLPLILVDPNGIKDGKQYDDDLEEYASKLKNNTVLNERVKGIFEDFVNKGVWKC